MKYTFIELIKSDLARYGDVSIKSLFRHYFFPRGGYSVTFFG